MFDKTPTETLAGYTYADDSLVIPIAALPQLLEAEADPTTGDIREIAFGLIEQLYQAQQALDSADRSAKLVIRRSSTIDQITSAATFTYTITVKRSVTGTEMADEPA